MSDVNICICLNICIADNLLTVIGDVHDPGNQFLAFFISSPALTRGVPCRVTMESITPSRVENRLHELSSGSAFLRQFLPGSQNAGLFPKIRQTPR